MANQFIRYWKTQIGEKVWESDEQGEGLRQAFVVQRDEANVPNNAELEIYNLSPDSRKYLEGNDSLGCRITAGYQDNSDQIFFGTLREAATRREGTDLITRLSAGDGEDEFITTKVKKLWKLGTPIAQVLKDHVKAMGVEPGNVDLLAPLTLLGGSPVLEGPYTASGGAFDAMNRFARAAGLTWSVQGGEFQGALTGQPSVLTPGPIVSARTGMIGVPTLETSKDKSGKQVTTLSFEARMLPNLRPGISFLLEAAASGILGTFICRTTDHIGDTQSADWTVRATAEPLA